MNFDEYQGLAESFAIFKHDYYPYASLMVESAELADLFTKQMLRGDNKQVPTDQIISEAGDVLWNLSVLLKRNGIKLSAVAQYNIDKLTGREERGTIMGDGER